MKKVKSKQGPFEKLSSSRNGQPLSVSKKLSVGWLLIGKFWLIDIASHASGLAFVTCLWIY
ncbi:TPA: hypothetical protein ACGO1T_001155 [Streptococcus suis]